MAHYLVTGGAGFIGSNICHALVQRGERVRIIDNHSTGRMENLNELLDKNQVELVRADITDGAAVASAVEGIDYILHQAAIPSVPRSVDDPLSTDLACVHGTVTLLDAAR